MHISFHQFLLPLALPTAGWRRQAYLNEIDLGKAIIITRSLDIEDRNDILMVEISQQFHLSQCSKTKHGVVERGDFFDGNFLA